MLIQKATNTEHKRRTYIPPRGVPIYLGSSVSSPAVEDAPTHVSGVARATLQHHLPFFPHPQPTSSPLLLFNQPLPFTIPTIFSYTGLDPRKIFKPVLVYKAPDVMLRVIAVHMHIHSTYTSRYTLLHATSYRLGAFIARHA